MDAVRRVYLLKMVVFSILCLPCSDAGDNLMMRAVGGDWLVWRADRWIDGKSKRGRVFV